MKKIITVLFILIGLNSLAQNLIWENNISNDTSGFELIADIEELSSGNLFFIASPFFGTPRLIKCNSGGDTIFSMLDSGLVEMEIINNDDELYLLRQEGSFFISGSNISRVDSNFNIVWTNQGPLQSHGGLNIIVTNDFGVVEIGAYGSPPERFIRKIDEMGNNLWIDSTTIGPLGSGSGGVTFYNYKVIEIGNGELVQLASQDQNLKLTKFDANGVYIDSVSLTVNGEIAFPDISYSAIDGFIYLNVDATIDSVTFEETLFKFDANLNQLWQYTTMNNVGVGGIEVTDQGLVIRTKIPSQANPTDFPELIVLDDSTEIGSVELSGIPWALKHVSNNSCILGGIDTIGTWIAKVGVLVVNLKPDFMSLKMHKVFPIPANQFVNFELSEEGKTESFDIRIHHISGAVMLEKTIEDKGFELDVSKYETGIYIYTINGRESSASGKFMVKH